MKIIVISSCYPRKGAPSNGIFIHQQIKALQSLGAECHIMQPVNWYPPFGLHKLHTYWQQGHGQLEQMLDSFEGVRIHHPRMFVKMPSRFFAAETEEIRMGNSIIQYVKSNKELKDADLIYAHFLCLEGLAGVIAKRGLKIPLAAIARGDDVHAWPEANPRLRKNLEIVFNEADVLLANSKRLAEDTQQWMNKNNFRKVDTIYNGVDHKRFTPCSSEEEKRTLRKKFNLAEDKKYLVCVATPVPAKGWIELLRAIKDLKEAFTGWELLMVAPPHPIPGHLDLIKEAEHFGITSLVRNTGSIPPSDMPLFFKTCDAFVLPSHNEGMSNSLLEAMSSGLPAIATNVGGHPEVIDHGKSGFLVAPRDAQALAGVLHTLITDSDLRKHFGREARKRMEAFGDYRENAEKLYQMFLPLSRKGKKA